MLLLGNGEVKIELFAYMEDTVNKVFKIVMFAGLMGSALMQASFNPFAWAHKCGREAAQKDIEKKLSLFDQQVLVPTAQEVSLLVQEPQNIPEAGVKQYPKEFVLLWARHCDEKDLFEGYLSHMKVLGFPENDLTEEEFRSCASNVSSNREGLICVTAAIFYISNKNKFMKKYKTIDPITEFNKCWELYSPNMDALQDLLNQQ